MSTQNSNNDNKAGSCKQKTLFGALSISAQETQIQVKPRVFQGSERVQVKKRKRPQGC